MWYFHKYISWITAAFTYTLACLHVSFAASWEPLKHALAVIHTTQASPVMYEISMDGVSGVVGNDMPS